MFTLPPPPTTTISLNPPSPNGNNGWYRSKVHASVSATDTGAGVTETRCALDAVNPPPSFDALLPGPCAFAGIGSDITTDGVHVLYAASVNQASEKDAPVRAAIKTDQTPPTLSCPVVVPIIQVGAREVVLTARVSDAGSGPVTSTSTARPGLSSPGRKRATFTGSDNAGNRATITCPYRVTPANLRPVPTMAYAFNLSPSFTTVTSMIVNAVAARAKVTVTCAGKGCPFALRSAPVVRPKPPPCKRKRCHKQQPQSIGNSDLAHLFGSAHLAVGTRISVRVTKPETVGRIWLFEVRSAQDPEVKVKCVAPGASAPGRGC